MNVPINTEEDGTSFTIKANYYKVSLANFLNRGGGTEQPESRLLIVGSVYKSKVNGVVYDPQGIAPCICVGAHSGVEPKIIVYED